MSALEPGTTIHVSLSVRGAIRWPKRMLKGMLKDERGRPYDAEAVREWLLDQLASGVELLPMGDCPGHDPKTGCPGHRAEVSP